MSRTRVKPGDLIGIPLAEDQVAVGLVLHISKVFTGSMLVGYYKQTFPSLEAVRPAVLGGEFIGTPNYTGTEVVRSGDWRVIGHNAELLAAAIIPELRVVGDLYYKDEITRRIPGEEWQQYTELIGQGGGFVESKLRRHFAKER